MSDEIRLWCWVYRDDVNSLFPVNIPKNNTVGDLKDIIRDKGFIRFRDVEAQMLSLYKVSLADDEDLEQALEGLTLGPHGRLRPMEPLSLVFPTPPPERHVHIVVTTPTGESRRRSQLHDRYH